MSDRPLYNDLWYRLLQGLCQLAGVVYCQARHTGRENIPPEGGMLVVANHESHFDPPLVGIGSPRRMNYLARDTLFRFRPFGWLIRSVGSIPIDRDGRAMGGIKTALRRLRQGEMVVVFPEGTRTPDGMLKPFRPGFTTLAVRGKAAVLPVGIAGAYACWPRHRLLPRPCKVHVHYGPPISAEAVARLGERELIAEVERRVRHCCEVARSHPVFAGKTGCG